jgi:tRNA threonylcarbamoyladenosine biosynthesis protein TsaB
MPIEGLRFMTSPCLLALDTATETCSVALLKDGAVVVRSELVGQRHSERALPMVDSILRDTRTALGDLDVIAFGAGPGSFTGLRIACGLAQGLAWGAGKQVIAVGNLMALAARVFEQAPDCGSVLCAIDARMHEAYCAVYQRGPQILEILAPQLARPAELAALARDADAVAGDALIAFPEVLPALDGRILMPGLRADAADIVRLAGTESMRQRAVAPHDAMPVYVRDHVALTTEERRLRAATA